MRPRQRFQEPYRPRCLVGLEPLARKRLEFFGETRTLVRCNDESMWLRQTVRVLDTDDGDFFHERMLEQASLYLLRREPFAADLEQFVGAAAVREVAVRIPT